MMISNNIIHRNIDKNFIRSTIVDMNKVIIGLLIVVVFVIGYYFYQSKDTSPKSVACASSCYIFVEDFSVKLVNNVQDLPNPDNTKTTLYKKGQIIEGNQGLRECHEQGCIREEIIIINVDGQNVGVSKTILIPYK